MTNDRDDLAALVEAYINVGTQDPFDAADAIIRAGWRPPIPEHEHNWVDVRDLVTGADFCTVCKAFR
jgi:hypothetical protein